MVDPIADIMWTAFQKGLEIELIELATHYMVEVGLSRLEAYEKALVELELIKD